MLNLSQEQLDALKWRVWNTFKTVVIPIALGILYVNLQETPDDLSILTSVELWESILYAIVLALIAGGLAGGDKVYRMGKGESGE